MKLIIVESPTKGRTISKFLGGDFVVQSSFGHIRDLPKGDLGIDVENNFKPKYVIPTKAKKNVTALKKYAAQADTVILATDEDREGEAIAWHLAQALGLGNTKSPARLRHDGIVADKQAPNTRQASKSKSQNSKKPVERIVFHEITKPAIEQALEHPRDIDENLVDAQQARRVLDRLVGYKLSPFLWKKVARGLSAGRVQSVAVRLIVEREREIAKFKPEEYWSITAMLETEKDGDIVPAQLINIGGKQLEKFSIPTQIEAQRIAGDLEKAEYTVKSMEKNELIRMPHAPFTTSTFQQDAVKKLRFSSKQAMMFAQQLYEAGYITYMRTDSVNLSSESLAKAKDFIDTSYGAKYYTPRRFKNKSKNAQEAHEAIRPTEPARTPEALKDELTPQQYKLYDLIWRRFIASQMAAAVFDSTAINIEARQPQAQSYGLRANGTTMKFDGYLKVYPTKFEENALPVVNDGQNLILKELKPEQHFTKPPARYNEASLIKTLEKEGIGRPSTYAPIISTILARNYVTKDRSRYFTPTEIGMMVNDLLVEHFPEIVNVQFTSHMEDELDEIAMGKARWVPIIREFYMPFARQLEEKYQTVSKEEVTHQEKTGQICDKCGGDMVVKMGRFGKFIACSNFPKCKNILKAPRAEPEKTGEKCDKCGTGDMVIRSSRFGKFIACSNYPKCKNTKKIPANSADGQKKSPPESEGES